jgi:hypothetical protein
MTGSAAALLALEPLTDVTPEYVGQLQLAKDYDVRPMYVLRAIADSSTPFGS